MVDKMKVACFSGHRNLPQDCMELQANLEKAIVELIERGVVFFGSGGAVGWDLLAAAAVLKLKEDYPHIRLVMVLPCPPEQQSSYWNDEQKKRYYRILEQADKVRILSPQYTEKCICSTATDILLTAARTLSVICGSSAAVRLTQSITLNGKA